jgi:nucleotide-binding universal stress UspA family protein
MAPCPVLAVKADKGSAAVPAMANIKRIVVPIDLSACSLDALEYAVQFAKPFGASITILHAMEPVAYGLDFSLSHAKEWKEQRAYLEKRLTVLVACVQAQGLQVDHVLKPGLPADSIASYVTQQGYDLMIMGTHGRRGISHVLVGSIAGAMLRHAPCPVLTVRQFNFGANYQRVVPLGEA